MTVTDSVLCDFHFCSQISPLWIRLGQDAESNMTKLRRRGVGVGVRRGMTKLLPKYNLIHIRVWNIVSYIKRSFSFPLYIFVILYSRDVLKRFKRFMFYDFKFYDLKRFMFSTLDVFSSLTFEMFRKSWGGYFHALENGNSSAVRVPDSWSKDRGNESWQERLENFLLQGQLSVLTLISVSVPPPCYRSFT